jgi:hypothetical protein
MGDLRCVDGSVLSVVAVSCRDRAGQPYEITLNLARDSAPFGAVGQRCGHQLADLAQRVAAARADPEQATVWPNPDDRFPDPGDHDPSPGRRVASFLPGESEYFALRSRDRADLPGTGELRCVLRSSAVWVGECVGTGQQHRPAARHAVPGQRSRPSARRAHRGQWRLSRRAVIEAWGATGIGVRAVLTSAELVAFLDTVLSKPESEAPAVAGTGIRSVSSQLACRGPGVAPRDRTCRCPRVAPGTPGSPPEQHQPVGWP